MVFDAFALILSLLLLGMAFARTSLLPPNAADVLNRVVLYVCVPAAVLRYVPRLSFDPALLGLVITPWALMGLTWLLVNQAATRWGFSRDARTALLLCSGLCNSSFLGIPVVGAVLGEDAVAYAVVYDQFGSFILLSTVALVILARHGGEAVGPWEMVARVGRFPPAWALLAALTVMPVEPPAWIAGGLHRLSDAMLPLVMLAVGLSLQLRLPEEDVRPVLVGLGIRLVVLPLFAIPIGWLVGMPEQMFRANVLEAAMPPMVSAAALAMSQGIAPRLCAAMVGYGILASMLTLPAWAWLLTA